MLKEKLEKETNKYAKRFYQLLTEEGYDLFGNDEYTKAKTKVRLTCPQGHIYKTAPDTFKRGHRCGKCEGGVPFEKGFFRDYVSQVTKGEYSVLGNYVNNSTPVKIKHNSKSCGFYEWDVVPSVFRNNGSRCPKCARRLKIDTDEYKKQVFDIVGEEYSVLGEYINSDTPIKMRHNSDECDYNEWNIKPYNFKKRNGNRCPICSGVFRLRMKTLKKRVRDLVGDEYKITSDYNGLKVEMTHMKCGHRFNVLYRNFLKGNRCLKCNESKGEKKISDFLHNCGLEFEREKTFYDLIHKRNLKCDFYLETQRVIIEYDGEQHHKPTRYSNNVSEKEAEKTLLETKLKDELKNRYAKEKGIRMIRIPYWDFENIEKILNEKLVERATS